ncbi:MAG: hypothetical protein HY577_02680 [Candidatus Nealsonbacteria bacterium]|nr:hypothetical protein [Candidatus Nealsonbacteria bacterium]
MKKLFYLQSLVILAGTLFAGYTIFGDFVRFFQIEGTIFKIKDCLIPNPVTTPCFWGGWAFLTALAWSLFILKMPADKQKIHQKYLVLLLVAGTIFGWSNFGLGWLKFMANEGRPTIGCSGVVVANPFSTPCFKGSLFFTASLLTAWIVLKKQKRLTS